MRVALLSTIDPPIGRQGRGAAFVRFAGASILERQLDLALAMECQTVVCFTESIGRDIIELQHRAERLGVKFVTIREPLALCGLVTAHDEIFVIGSAVLPDNAAVMRSLHRPAVLAFPAEPAVALGFERINAELAWSGVLLARGSVVERLADLPIDADPASALLRIALQNETRVVPLEQGLIDGEEWHFAPNERQLAEREHNWIGKHALPAAFTAPGLAIAERMGARLAKDVLGKGGARMVWFGAGLAGVIGLTLAAAAMPAVGLGFAALMVLLGAMGRVIERIARAGAARPRRPSAIAATRWIEDAVLVVLLALSSPPDTGWLRYFVAIMLFGLLHLGERLGPDRLRPTYRDRVTAAFLLAAAAILGFGQLAAAVLALCVLVSLFLKEKSEQLTPD